VQPLEFFHRTQTTGRPKLTHNLVFATLIMSWRPKPTRGRLLQFDSFKETVERKIEIQTSLFPVGHNVEAGGQLIVQRCDYGVVLKFGAISRPKLVEVAAGQFQPSRERITSDY
jgi:hypothetical protein